MNRQAHIGTFNSEAYWRSKELAKLPSIKDSDSDNILMAMDELLFAFCDKDDGLVTRFTMNEALKTYLFDLGFSFRNNEVDVYDINTDNRKVRNKSISELLINSDNQGYFKEFLGNSSLDPYSILPQTKELCHTYGLEYNLPDVSVVKKVNSKVYSCQLNSRIGCPIDSKVVTSSNELNIVGKRLLGERAFLIKDSFGVSGKGNFLVDNDKMLTRLVKYVSGQERKGKKVEFIVEPFLDKEVDFSCQLYINEKGDYTILSLQKMLNNNFAYQGSCEASEAFVSLVDKSGYFTIIEAIVKELYREGYFGYVGIDSMILKDSTVIPIVEINTRKSMGLINHYIDKHLSKFSTSSNLTMLSVGFKSNLEYEQLIHSMDEGNILFTPQKGKGIMPLSANTLLVNKKLDVEEKKEFYRGRFYFSVVGNEVEERYALLQQLKEILKSKGLIIY